MLRIFYHFRITEYMFGYNVFFSGQINARLVIVFIILHILSLKGWCSMKDETGNSSASDSRNLYDDGNIPPEDTPQEVIPDEVPRKDGPGGE